MRYYQKTKVGREIGFVIYKLKINIALFSFVPDLQYIICTFFFFLKFWLILRLQVIVLYYILYGPVPWSEHLIMASKNMQQPLKVNAKILGHRSDALQRPS